ncbi:unnamed protein product [Somion occarium]|uniref:Uncharacterized protein n=1 Tax=Somion occarium TaxID=3059160 RepID=A0ABP1DRG6_9APHY
MALTTSPPPTWPPLSKEREKKAPNATIQQDFPASVLDRRATQTSINGSSISVASCEGQGSTTANKLLGHKKTVVHIFDGPQVSKHSREVERIYSHLRS